MTTLLPQPKAKFFGTDGLPLNGGKVYFYDAGTTTPKNTYTNYGGLTANTNPVVLDAYGEADIWLSDGLYKVVLKTSADVTLWTVDNVGDLASVASTAGFGQAATIASASQVDLGTINSHFAAITGTTTITSFGSSAAITAPLYLIKFDNALTLTHSSNLLLPGSDNITTAAQDRAWCEYLGSGAWRVFAYMKANGAPTLYGPATAANAVLIGPASGADAVPTFRALTTADVPLTYKKQIYTSGSGSWTSPANTTSSMVFKVTVTGGGGGGGYGNLVGTGGGAGATAIKYVTGLAASTNYAYVVGTGGAGGTSGAQTGTTGGNSTFNDGTTTYTGAGGVGGTPSGGLGGLGGSATNGDINIAGGDGDGSNNAQIPGGSGGASYWGSGGTGGNAVAGTSGRAYGSGGGAATNSNNGGSGASGIIQIEWIG